MLKRFDLAHFQRSAELAREIEGNPDLLNGFQPFKSYRIQQFVNELKQQNDQAGLSAENPAGGEARILRFLLRVATAPLFMAFERELKRDVDDALANGRQIGAPGYLEETGFDRRFTGHGRRHYSARYLNFMRTASALSYAAASRVIGRIHNGQAPELAPIWYAFWHFDSSGTAYDQFYRPFTMRISSPRERLLDHVIAANGTALRLLLPAASYNLLDDTEVLSRAAATPVEFFDAHFPEIDSAIPPKRHPFVFTDKDVALGGMWRFRALQPRTTQVWGFCPGNIPFPRNYPSVTGAQLRLESLIPIARETLWTPEGGRAA